MNNLQKDIDNLCIKNIRMLCLEMIDKAKSGHPGMALGSAPILHTLFTRVLKASNKNPNWVNRDRFILSSGHASSLLYTILHLCEYGLTIDDLKEFRQLGSITPGHPEIGITAGVDASTGPLGQGFAYGVGTEIAQKYMNTLYPELIDHYTYVLCGDGDIQEGIAKEAMSIAGVNALNKLIVIYDSNDIQLDGEVSRNYDEDLALEAKSLKWNYIKVTDGNDCDAIYKAIKKAQKSDKPTLIEVKTIIGYGTKNAGTNKVHGAPIPHEETVELRQEFGGEPFDMLEEVYAFYKKTFIKRGNKAYKEWDKIEKSESFINFINGKHDVDYSKLTVFNDDVIATRKSGSIILKEISLQDKLLIGGSADLASSVQTYVDGGTFSKDNYSGRNIYFGVREAAMGAIANAITMYGIKAFASSFFAFSDYMKPSLRLAALSKLPTIFIYSHDSIAVGEDGPTHQPIEQLTMLRSIPGLITVRPCDSNETKEAYKLAYSSKVNPYALILSRQVVNQVTKNPDVSKGAYILSKEENKLDGIIVASGSEVSLSLDAKEILKSEGYDVRVVSMPSIQLFDMQSEEYRNMIFPHGVRKLVLEMSEAIHYRKYMCLKDKLFNINEFGVSGKASDVINHFGFTKENICIEFKKIIQK